MLALRWASSLLSSGSEQRSSAEPGLGRRELALLQGSAWEVDTDGGKEWRMALAAAQGQPFCADNVSGRRPRFFLNK